MKPMLATDSNEKVAAKHITSDDWWLQQKLDGDRVLVRVANGEVSYLNRQGVPRSKHIPRLVEEFFAIPDGIWYFDGELIDDELHIFDVIIDGLVSVRDPYERRHEVLTALFSHFEANGRGSGGVHLLHTAKTTVEKGDLIAAVNDAGGEGWILRHRLGPYQPGARSAKLLKLKRWHSVDCVIVKVGTDGKENATLGLMRGGRLVEVGRTSLLGKPEVQVGDVAEIKYLYVGANNRLYQPTLLRRRDDKTGPECSFDQLDGSWVNKAVIDPTITRTPATSTL